MKVSEGDGKSLVQPLPSGAKRSPHDPLEEKVENQTPSGEFPFEELLDDSRGASFHRHG